MTILPDLTALIVSVIVVALVLVLKSQFFEPLARVLEHRELERGAAREERRSAAETSRTARERTEEAVAGARRAGYAEMDRLRQEAGEEAGQRLEAARRSAQGMVAAGRVQLRDESARAEAELESEAQQLGAELTARVLPRAS